MLKTKMFVGNIKLSDSHIFLFEFSGFDVHKYCL